MNKVQILVASSVMAVLVAKAEPLKESLYWQVDTAKVEQVLTKMTFEEKLEEINLGKMGMRASKPNARLGIPPTRAINGPRGPGDKVPNNVCYPVALALAASWDMDLMEQVGEEWARAMIETRRNHIFGPGVNICRHPLAGRNAEYNGEDPFLAGKLVAAEIRGIQKHGCVATLKHYAGNDFECGRNLVNVTIPERPLREVYLKPYQICVEEGNVLEIMTGYNRINGVYCSANAEILGILRREWGFRGTVVSDFGAFMVGAAAALNAGSNIELNGWHYFAAKEVKAALASGELKQETLDQRVREILAVKFSKGFNDCTAKNVPFDIEKRRALARRAAASGMVLLKNDRNLLPLKPGLSAALIGPFQDPDCLVGSQGSSNVNPERLVGLREELERRLTTNLAVAAGCGPADPGDGVARTEFVCKAEYYNNLELKGDPALTRTEKTIQKLSFTGAGVAEAAAGGVIGKSLLFKGQSAARLTDLPGWDASADFAISFWVNYLDQFPNEKASIFSLSTPPKDEFEITPRGLSVGTARVTRQNARLNFTIPSLKWTHVAVVRHDGILTAHVDGKCVARGEMKFAFPGTPLYVGGEAGQKECARAMVDEVRFYKTALSEAQVKALAERKSVEDGLCFHANCDEAIKGAEDESYPGIRDVQQLSARWTGKFIPRRSGRHAFEFITSGGMRMRLDGKLVIEQFDEQMGRGLHLETWPVLEAGREYDLCLEFSNLARHGGVFRFTYYDPPSMDLFAEARAAAKGKDVAIVAVGVHQNLLQGESNDNEMFDLPGYQAELIDQVSAVNPNTVVVLCSAGGVGMQSWIGKVPAVLEAFFPGQEAGNSLCDVLLGEVNPSGKLPMTYPLSIDQIPFTVADPNYPDDLCAFGYRLFDKRRMQPQFPFGHGLSYTTFGYDKLKLTSAASNVVVSLILKNTGNRAGAEVVQVYAGPATEIVDRPVRELKGFAKVMLNPGESRLVEIAISRDALSWWEPSKKAWALPAGSMRIEVGSSSRDIRLTGLVELPR